MFCNDILTLGKIIKLGSTGSDVTQLQNGLNLIGYPINANGIYAQTTKNAIIDYQKTHNLYVDGVVGKQTAGSLCSLGYLTDTFQEPKKYVYPSQPIIHFTNTSNATPSGFIKLPTEQAISAKIKSLPAWIWYVIIGGGLLMIMGGR